MGAAPRRRVVAVVGYRSTGIRNVALGRSAGEDLTTGSGNIDLSNTGVAGESGKIRIGTPGTQTAAYLAGVSGVSTSGRGRAA